MKVCPCSPSHAATWIGGGLSATMHSNIKTYEGIGSPTIPTSFKLSYSGCVVVLVTGLEIGELCELYQ